MLRTSGSAVGSFAEPCEAGQVAMRSGAGALLVAAAPCGQHGRMARTARKAPGGVVFHRINRGVGRRKLFRKPQDYAAFERVMAHALDAPPVRLLAYFLMPYHWHLLLWPSWTRSWASSSAQMSKRGPDRGRGTSREAKGDEGPPVRRRRLAGAHLQKTGAGVGIPSDGEAPEAQAGSKPDK